MGVLDWFKSTRLVQKYSSWKELGTFNARFIPFGFDVYKSEVVRSCIRPLAEHTSKANAVCTNKDIERLLNLNPNMYMNGKDMLAKVRNHLEIKNTAFIYIMRDDKNHVTGFYPVPYSSFEAVEYRNGLFINFYFDGSAARNLVLSWKDLVPLRKDYNSSDIAGDDNGAILEMLDLISTSNQGIANAVKATANLRGILKSTKAMLSDEDIKKNKDRFVKDYLSLENEGGIASLDATQEFTPISMNPTITNWATMKEFRENVQRYYGVSDAIIKSDYTEQQMEAFYDARIEPFLLALSLELTRKVFTEREIAFGNKIVYESSRINFASTSSKLSMVQLVDRGLMTPNEYRGLFNLAPYEGGDEFIMRLDTAKTGDVSNETQSDSGDISDKESEE